MTNNTIPNVPRELLERVLNAGWGSETVNALDDLRDFLESAQSPAGVDADHVEDVRAMVADPSPAGVDWLEVVGWYRMDDRKAITPYPSVCATWHKMGVKVGAAYSDSAQAIIDGLRGDVEVMTQHANNYSRMFEECAEERDQQARRIGELERLLREARKDKTRLDQIVMHGISVSAQLKSGEFCGPRGREWRVFKYGKEFSVYGETLREALDKAITALSAGK